MGKIAKQWVQRRHSSPTLPIEPFQIPWSAISQLLSFCPCAHICYCPRFASLCFSLSWPCYTLLTSQQGESYCHQANPPFLGLPIKKNPSISNKISLLPEAESCLALQSSVPCYCEKTWDMNMLCPYSLLTEEKKKKNAATTWNFSSCYQGKWAKHGGSAWRNNAASVIPTVHGEVKEGSALTALPSTQRGMGLGASSLLVLRIILLAYF